MLGGDVISGLIRCFWVIVLGVSSQILWRIRHLLYLKGFDVLKARSLEAFKPRKFATAEVALFWSSAALILQYSLHIIWMYVRQMRAIIRPSKRLWLHRLIVHHVRLFRFLSRWWDEYVLGHLLHLHSGFAVVACVTASWAMRYKFLGDHFQADSFDQPAEFLGWGG